MTAAITGFEHKLLDALRAWPDRLEMWIGAGDPLRNHRDLIALYTRFFDICNTHGIEYWREYGSRLGYVRHRGIIPWEWDMDIGCTTANFQKFLAVGEAVERGDPRFGFRYYHDPDYGSPGYSFYLKAKPQVLCDICEYRQDSGKLICAVDSWHYPAHNVSDILPLQLVTMLGQSSMIPAHPEAVLRNTQSILGQCTGGEDDSVGRNRIGYEQYDPVPFLLSHLYHPDTAERLCSPPVLDVDEAPTIRDGFETYGSAGLPFVVRNCRIADLSNEAFLHRMEQGSAPLFGWDADQLRSCDVPLRDAVAGWKRGALASNIVDAPISGLFTAPEVDRSLEPYGITAGALMLVLSKGLACTPFHQDAPAEGGGWMWLAEGQKLWNLVDFEDCDALLDRETKTLFDLAPRNCCIATTTRSGDAGARPGFRAETSSASRPPGRTASALTSHPSVWAVTRCCLPTPLAWIKFSPGTQPVNSIRGVASGEAHGHSAERHFL